MSTAHKLDASDFIARIFVAGRSKPVEGSDLDTVVAVTAHGVGFRLRVSVRDRTLRVSRVSDELLIDPSCGLRACSAQDGAVVAFQHSYSIPRLCDMRRGDSGFTALNAGEMTLGQWEVSSMDNPPLWCVRLDPLMHTDIRCVRHFKTGSGTVVLVSSAGGQTLMLSAVVSSSTQRAYVYAARRCLTGVPSLRRRMAASCPSYLCCTSATPSCSCCPCCLHGSPAATAAAGLPRSAKPHMRTLPSAPSPRHHEASSAPPPCGVRCCSRKWDRATLPRHARLTQKLVVRPS